MTDVTVSRFQRMRPVVNFNPPYQREGNVWKERTKAILIDSILNGLDVPKLYFEVAHSRVEGPDGLSYQYAVLDGKQRLEAINQFYANELRLDEDFRFFNDESVRAGGMTLADLEREYPRLFDTFIYFELPIVTVTSDSDDLIDEMFQRLNASTAINAAERRNSVRGQTQRSTNELAEHPLLVDCSPIRNGRYKHRELAAKFLAIEHQMATSERVVDTKAATLLRLFEATRETTRKIEDATVEEYQRCASRTLDEMVKTFVESDWLLASVGTMVVYYISFREDKFTAVVDRDKLEEFEYLRREAGHMDVSDPEYAAPENARLREYNSLVQSTNDGNALSRRVEILRRFVEGHVSENPLAGLEEVREDDPPMPEDDEEL